MHYYNVIAVNDDAYETYYKRSVTKKKDLKKEI